jgi:hypothetical protein
VLLLREHVDVPEPPVMLVGLHVAVSPVEGLIEVARLTVPVKPLSGDTVALNPPVPPELNMTLVGLAVIVKSGCVLKNSVIALAFASFEVRLGRFQLVSIVSVNE